MDNKPVLRVFVPMTFEGVTSVAILEEITSPDIHMDIRYTGHLDFREYENFSGADMIMILGAPYKGYPLPEAFYTSVNVPFMDFIHCATHGETIEGDHIISMVNTEADPIKEVCQFLNLHPESSVLSKHLTFTDKAWQMIEAVNAYRIWDWETNNTTKLLLAMYQASHKWLPNLLRGLSLQEAVKAYAPVIKGQMEKMKDYIVRKREMTKVYHITFEGVPCTLKVVYADEYINELANELLNLEPTSSPVIVCVGRTTKSGDVLSIRTKVVNAGKVAYMINEGNGKETVASVFTGAGYAEILGNAIVRKLMSHSGE
ncbi:hypothetical protein BSP38_145 [Bacillus phage BSP38]|uniref:Exopolyphosphatase n=1 Tax=Bacillus phage BSP38 TaxID=2283013 RepID=A0A345MK05_BPBSP|nr:exopolyphosphatase [Bacillus phage BSP38]AXH71187.1 hypothetical protein BSP38_145 [Bacillus phage BSP38]